jgi:hypothetical protein
MKTAAWAWMGLPPCCAAISASNGFDPGASASAVEAVKQSQAGVVPACVVDRADALVDGQVRIRPGETPCIRVRLNDDRPELVALVDGADAADALVITASLSQGRTLRTLKNPLSQWLRYRACVRVGGQLSYTSSCPVMSNIAWRSRIGPARSTSSRWAASRSRRIPRRPAMPRCRAGEHDDS